MLLLLSRFSRVRLCDPIDGSPPGSSRWIFQARTLEWAAISFSNAWKWKVKVKSLSCIRLLATPWTAAYQAPPPMGFSRQEYWSGVPLPSLIRTFTRMLMVDLFLIAPNWKKPTFPSMVNRYNTLLYIHINEYYEAMKVNKSQILLITQMNHKSITLSGRKQDNLCFYLYKIIIYVKIWWQKANQWFYRAK